MSGYLWRVVCAAIVCALVGAIAPDGSGNRLRRLTAGLFLTSVVLSPVFDSELPKLDLSAIRSDAQSAVRAGTEQARQAQNAIITESLEAYIWNKAAQLGLEVQVRIDLDDAGLPRTVELIGNLAPADRETLGSWIVRELGLGKEALVWTTPHQSSE